MVNQPSTNQEPLPLHELMGRVIMIGEPTPPRQFLIPALGTMQSLNQALINRPGLDFINFILRGIGQVIFVNNPVSGLLIGVALFIQSPWMAAMALLGGVASTLTAIWLKLDRDAIRNGIFGYNGILVGAALATFGLVTGTNYWAWAIAVSGLSALTTGLMKTLGVWMVTTLKCPALTVPFNLVSLLFLAIAPSLPQSIFQRAMAEPPIAAPLNSLPLAESLLTGFGQVFLVDNLIAALFIFIAIAICTPLGAVVGLFGSILGVIAGLMMGVNPTALYAGLWGYNAVLTAIAIGGIFYAPNLRSVLIGLVCAFLSGLVGGVLSLLFSPLGLPSLTLAFCVVTIAAFALLQRSLPSQVPVALSAITSPEEHLQRFYFAKDIISNFRRQLEIAMMGEQRRFLFESASAAVRGDLRYLFDAIDTNGSKTLSVQELTHHLRQVDHTCSDEELTYLFKSLDVDGSGEIDFEEFGEILLRQRRFMTNFHEFITYFLPLDADGDNAIGLDEMNIALKSVGEAPLKTNEIDFLQYRTGQRPMTWNQFIEVLLVT